MERTPLVAGNWKMFKTRAEAADFCSALLPLVDDLDEVDLAVCPPFTALDIVAERIGDAGVGVWGQNVHDAAEGAFTGEISCGMLIDAGATGVLLGPLRAPRALRRDRRGARAQARRGARAPASSRCSASARARPSATAARPRAA